MVPVSPNTETVHGSHHPVRDEHFVQVTKEHRFWVIQPCFKIHGQNHSKFKTGVPVAPQNDDGFRNKKHCMIITRKVINFKLTDLFREICYYYLKEKTSHYKWKLICCQHLGNNYPFSSLETLPLMSMILYYGYFLKGLYGYYTLFHVYCLSNCCNFQG